MTLRDALLLGRVSNLPTVWTNMLAGAVLSGAAVQLSPALLGLIAVTLFYVGGMYLNDAFDAGIDAEERPERPIPSGRVSRSTVFVLGFGMLVAALLVLAIVGGLSSTGWRPVAAGAALGGTIVLYDAWHKSNPLSPLIMGACRMLVYVTAAYCLTTELSAPVIVGAVVVLCFLIGLTYVAKQENLGQVANQWPLAFLAAPVAIGVHAGLSSPLVLLFTLLLVALIGAALFFVRRSGPGDIPRAVLSLIAGISLVDAVLMARADHPELAGVAVVGFVLTLALQRFVPGT